MKNLITTLSIIILTATIAFASTNPVPVISNEEVEVFDLEEKSIFTSAQFNSKKNNLEFETSGEVQMIMVFNDQGEKTYQFPVDSKYVRLNKNMFDKGQSRLGFIMKDSNKTHFTSVKIN